MLMLLYGFLNLFVIGVELRTVLGHNPQRKEDGCLHCSSSNVLNKCTVLLGDKNAMNDALNNVIYL